MITGCTKISDGCKNCYAEAMAIRFGRDFSKVVCHEEKLDEPTRWQRPRKIFVCSTSDLFHDHVPIEFIDKVFAVMAANPRHTFQVLTKRTARMYAYLQYATSNGYKPLPNVWIGTTIENQNMADTRMPFLMRCEAVIRFVSIEPMIGPVDISKYMSGCYGHLDWVIVGGESGPAARLCLKSWVDAVVEDCKTYSVPLMFKQWGTWLPALPDCMPENTIDDCQDSCRRAIDGKQTSGKSFPVTVVTAEDVATMEGAEYYVKIGKKFSGRLIGGREYLEYPANA